MCANTDQIIHTSSMRSVGQISKLSLAKCHRYVIKANQAILYKRLNECRFTYDDFMTFKGSNWMLYANSLTIRYLYLI